ncbi:MAG: DUF4402 domain-containing protein [Sphingomonas sp.]|nr:DUF4402 domain-containing protein [Sphingomonas sp.]
MKTFLRTAAAVAALALGATPALAANATQNATATARIIKPLSLTSKQNLDLGSITLVGSGSTTVGLSRAGVFSCPVGNVTCSGTTQVAVYTVTGTNNQSVTVTAPDFELVNQADNTLKLMLDVDAPATVPLGNSGSSGTDFPIGGAVTVSGATSEGTYVGNFVVTVNY